MHIPGKRSSRHRSPRNRFFRQWATARRRDGKDTLTWARDLMLLPNAQQVAQIAGNARRLAMWQDSCEQANEAHAVRRCERYNLGIRRSRHVKPACVAA